MRYTTPSSGRETCQTAGLIPTTCRLFRLSFSTFGAADAVGTFQVNAYAQDGRLLGPAFQVDIKPRRTINTTTIFSIAAPGLVPPNVPTQASLLDELNRIFPRQTNVTFTSVLMGDNIITTMIATEMALCITTKCVAEMATWLDVIQMIRRAELTEVSLVPFLKSFTPLGSTTGAMPRISRYST